MTLRQNLPALSDGVSSRDYLGTAAVRDQARNRQAHSVLDCVGSRRPFGLEDLRLAEADRPEHHGVPSALKNDLWCPPLLAVRRLPSWSSSSRIPGTLRLPSNGPYTCSPNLVRLICARTLTSRRFQTAPLRGSSIIAPR
jgi:hypothetical protein